MTPLLTPEEVDVIARQFKWYVNNFDRYDMPAFAAALQVAMLKKIGEPVQWQFRIPGYSWTNVAEHQVPQVLSEGSEVRGLYAIPKEND